jgi:uncharacterized Tic20 family protein
MHGSEHHDRRLGIQGGSLNTAPTSDEKIIAALAHGSIFFMFLGPVAPVLIWSFQRKKSKYVCFHALQAMGYQAFMFWFWIATVILIAMLTVCLAFPLSISIMENSRNSIAVPFLIQFLIFLSIFGMLGLFLLTGMVGAISCLLGRDFRYPWIGKRLEKLLPYSVDSESPIDEAQEDHWVAGVCHATAILQIWGIATPLVVWFTQKERSARLRFQAMQAAVYQGIALFVYLAGMVLQMIAFFGMFVIFTLGTVGGRGEVQGPLGATILILFGILMMIFALGTTILMPIYYLLAALGIVRTIQGRPFRYPIIGRILAKRMQISQSAESTP